MKSPQITRVEMSIGGRNISLTIPQVMELKRILNDTFPDPVRFSPLAPMSPGLIHPIPHEIQPLPWEQWQTWCQSIPGTNGSVLHVQAQTGTHSEVGQ